jgi:hypothetical protein
MRKMNWLVGSIALGIGLVVGVVGYALAVTTPLDGNSRFVSLWDDKDSQSVSGNLQDTDTTMNPSDLNPLDPNTLTQNNPNSASGESDMTNPLLTPETENNGVNAELAHKIITDYKQDLGFFFEAWKSTDMLGFRSKLSKAYKGDVYENHARQAERFIAQGLGIDVSEIQFNQVDVESGTETAATLIADYCYTAQDYDIGEQLPAGEKTEHQVKVRVNLIYDGARWLITGETPVL